MRRALFILSITFAALCLYANPTRAQSDALLERLEGITHYGMAIEEIRKIYRKENARLTIIYSPTLSDDNMDDYVKRFYDELLRQVEAWLYDNTLPARELSIVISNCKFCKVGYCKKKGIREVRLASWREGVKSREIAFTHIEIIDRAQYAVIARSAVTTLLGK